MEQRLEWSEAPLAETAAGGGVDIFRVCWTRKWMILLIVLLAGGLGYLFYLKATPIYRSRAEILLIRKEADIPGPHGMERSINYENELSTHMILIRSPEIVGRAMQNHDLASRPTLAREANPEMAVIKNLDATRGGGRKEPDPNVFELTYQSTSPEDSEIVLDAIVRSYQDYQADMYKTFSDETVHLITRAKDDLLVQLAEKRQEYSRFRQESRLLWNGSEAANLYQARMAEIESARAAALVENAQLKARIESIEAALAEGGRREALMLLVGDTDEQHGRVRPHNPLEDKLFAALLEEAVLLEEYGPDHPQVQAISKQVKMIRERLGGMPIAEDQTPADFLATYVESLRQELEIGKEKLAEYDELYANEEADARQLGADQLKDETLREEIAQRKELLDSIKARLSEINLVKDYGGTSAELIAPPGPGTLVFPKLAVVLPVACFLGLLLGVGVAYLADVADRRFRTPEDVRRQLGLPIVGHIPVIAGKATRAPTRGKADGAEKTIDFAVRTFHNPKGRLAEAYRAVRTSLYFSSRGQNHKVVQVTSPNAGDGKTTLAANLAVSIANSGKKVLVMDADFRRPRLDKCLALDGTIGLSALITEKAELPEAIQETGIENLWAMACGERPGNPADLLTSPRFAELLDTLREQFDFVIIDTPPLLAVTDPSTVAARADAVLLVIRLTKHAREASLRALGMLESLGADVLGVIVNGVGHGSRYGYDYRYRDYRYGGYHDGYYRYGYGYGYASGYSDKHGNGNGDYFTDAPSKERSTAALPRSGKPT